MAKNRFSDLMGRVPRGLSPGIRMVAWGLHEHGWRVTSGGGRPWSASILGKGGRACSRCRHQDRRVERCEHCPPAPARRCAGCRAAAPPPPLSCEHARRGLAEWAGVSRSTVHRGVRELVAAALIIVERRTGRGRACAYYDPRLMTGRAGQPPARGKQEWRKQGRKLADLVPGPDRPRGP